MPKTFRLIALSLVGLAILLGLIALGMGKRGDASRPETVKQDPQQPTAQIIVAAKSLPAGAPLELGDVTSIDAPGGNTAGYMTSPLQAKGLIPSRDIPEGTHLRSDHFLRGLSSHLNPGERAIAVGVDEIGAVGNHIQPGDYVDVYINLDGPSGRDSDAGTPPMAISRLLASRLRVLAIGGASVAEEGSSISEASVTDNQVDVNMAEGNERAAAINARVNAQQGSNASRPRSRGSAAAVLAVSPDDAATLLLAAQEGRLSLSLRNPADPAVANPDLFQPSRSLAAVTHSSLTADDRAYAGAYSQHLVPRLPQQTPQPSIARTPVRRHGTSTRPHRSSGVQIIRGNEAPRALSTK